MMARKSVPYVMRGAPRVTRKQPTVLDDPDPRVAPLGPQPPITLQTVRRVTGAARTALSAVDHLARRWASGEGASGERGGMHPLETIRLLHDGAVLGAGPVGVPADIALFDECYRQADGYQQGVISIWYGNNWTVDIKAARLGVSRATLYRVWSDTLSSFRGWLKAHGLEI